MAIFYCHSGLMAGGEWQRFMGDPEEVKTLLAISQILFLPSRGETSPLSILEGMACLSVCFTSE